MQTKIIQLLKKSSDYISGEDISRQLHISRAAIWKQVEEFRNAGYDIVAVPHLGYRLISSPDKLFPFEVQDGLQTHTIGGKFLYFDSLASTMDYAFQLGVQDEKEGTVICAENQTKGRGRMGRVWSSPKGKGIYCSILLRPQLHPADIGQMTLMTAVAVCRVIRQNYGLDAKIKWPNDILIGKKKLVGILTELSAEVDRIRFVVIGIGINVNTPLGSLPAQATSLKCELKKSVSRVDLIRSLLCSLEKEYDGVVANGFKTVIEDWKKLSSTLNRRIRLEDGKKSIEGKAIDLDQYGGLVIRTKSGSIVKRMSGDVFPL